MRGYFYGILIVAAAAFGMRSCSESDWYKADQARAAAQAKAEATPHVIREADGCKVYAFKSGDRFHYFTRCANSQTSTESSWTENCGKNCTETITSN